MKTIKILKKPIESYIAYIVCALILVSSLFSQARAAIGISISGANFLNADGITPMSDGSLFQLINLGDDGVTNRVLPGSWVSGDDVLIDLPYGGTEFATSGGFDLSEGANGIDGLLTRTFSFDITPGIIEVGDLLAVRWWSGLTVNDFETGLLPDTIHSYGEARIETAITAGNTGWVVPAESEPLAIFEPLISSAYNASIGGFLTPTPGFDGIADLEVIPEPSTTISIFAIGLMFIMTRYRSLLKRT